MSAKNEKGHRLMSKNIRWWLLLMLLLSVEERNVHRNSEGCIFRLGSLKNQFNSKQVIQILQPIIINKENAIELDVQGPNICILSCL